MQKKFLLLSLIAAILLVLQNGCNSEKNKENSQEQEESHSPGRELPPAINR